jgi:excisionase family DNA binding protein
MTSKIQLTMICQFCGAEFLARTSVTQHCGERCAKRAYKARLKKAKIERSESETKTARLKNIEEIKAKDFLSVADTCKLLGLSERTVFRLLKSKTIPSSKFGRRIIIKRADHRKLKLQTKAHKPKRLSEPLM